jgi:hypothetical protein
MNQTNEKKYDTISSISESSFIPHPKVGEEVDFTVKGFLKTKDTIRMGKDGKKFDIKLSSADFGVEIDDITGKTYTVPSWEELKRILQIFQKLNNESGAGVRLKIKHIADGQKSKNIQAYEVYTYFDDTWNRLDKNNDWVEI